MADRASALPEVIAMRCARVRTAVAGPIAAVLVACAAVAPVLAGAASADDAPAPLPWYQVEVVLFAQDAAGALTDENLRTDETPVWPPRALALAPPYPEPVRPATLAELAALWNDATSVPQLQQVTPGLLPEDELLIRWLRRQSRNGRATGLDWQYGLDALVWLEPERPVDGDADPGRSTTLRSRTPLLSTHSIR
jgi:hypothetical protein